MEVCVGVTVVVNEGSATWLDALPLQLADLDPWPLDQREWTATCHFPWSGGRWMLLARRQPWCECELKCGCVSATEHVISVSASVCACVCVCLCACLCPHSQTGCSTAGVTESLNHQSCQGKQTQDSELANIQTLFPYIFMKGHLLAADRVFRSVSRVIYRPASAEGLYIWGWSANCWAARSSSVLSVVDACVLLHTHKRISAVCHTPVESVLCMIAPVWQLRRFNSALISSFDW